MSAGTEAVVEISLVSQHFRMSRLHNPVEYNQSALQQELVNMSQDHRSWHEVVVLLSLCNWA